MRYSFVANHFQYVACVGLTALAVAGMTRWLDGPGLAKTGRQMVAALLLGVLAPLSWRNTLAYADAETLWRDTLRKIPGAWIAHHNRGIELDAQVRHAEAKAHYRAALELKSSHFRACHKLGRSFAREGRLDEAIAHFEAAVHARWNPGEAGVRINPPGARR